MQQLESLIQAIPANIFNPALNNLTGLQTTTNPSPSPAPVHSYPLGVPPPSLTSFPLANPAGHFALPTTAAEQRERDLADLAEATSKLSLTHSYLYLDDQGSTRWQGESSGLPLLDVLLEEDRVAHRGDIHVNGTSADGLDDGDEDAEYAARKAERGPRTDELDPGAVWKAVTAVVPPDLMDA
jgi:nucleoid-associated protein YgaU